MAADLIKEYLTKYPEMPSLTLAKMIYEEHWQLYKNVESVRDSIRVYRGTHGNQNRKDVKNKSFFNQKPVYKYNLANTETRSFEPYIMPKAATNILVMSDIHFPYHDPKAIEVALDWGLLHGINTILLNGDILDFYGLSKFTKDPTAMSIRGEIQMLRDFLKGLHEALPNVKVYYKMGNHEERFENYLKSKAPELFGAEEFRLDVLLHLAEYGVEYITDKRKVMAGMLPILHGHELNGISATVNPARGLYLKTKQSAMCGHLHRSSEHNDNNLDAELSTTESTGCLCDLHPEYAPYNGWNHGFAHIKVYEDGTFRMFNARMYNYKVL